jgi:hypothetical protein
VLGSMRAPSPADVCARRCTAAHGSSSPPASVSQTRAGPGRRTARGRGQRRRRPRPSPGTAFVACRSRPRRPCRRCRPPTSPTAARSPRAGAGAGRVVLGRRRPSLTSTGPQSPSTCWRLAPHQQPHPWTPR